MSDLLHLHISVVNHYDMVLQNLKNVAFFLNLEFSLIVTVNNLWSLKKKLLTLRQCLSRRPILMPFFP